MIKIVLIRHGQTTYNARNLFTGWIDVDLSARGQQEATRAGKILKQQGFNFDLGFDSYLKRSRKTLAIILQTWPTPPPKVIKDWRLNERHYGALQGQSKPGLVAKYGEKQVLAWRRGYSVRPPVISKTSKFSQSHDAKYQGIKVPRTESLRDVEARVRVFWRTAVIPELKKHKKIIISASGNSLRALVKYLDKIPAQKISELNIPTGIPLVYELNDNFKPRKHYYLASPKELEQAVAEVKNQVKKKS